MTPSDQIIEEIGTALAWGQCGCEQWHRHEQDAKAVFDCPSIQALVEAARNVRAKNGLGHYHGPLGGCSACELDAALEPFEPVVEEAVSA